MSPPRAATHGYTLLELVIAMGMTSLLIASGVSLLLNQQTAYRAGATERGLQETGQMALLSVGEQVRSAGYGIDPAYAIDFGEVADVPQQGLRGTQKLGGFTTYACTTPVRCRDQVNPPDARGSDEIVFYSRNPMFSRTVAAATTGSLTLGAPVKSALHKGQVLQVMCLGGNKLRAYVTVAREVPAGASDVQLEPEQLVSTHTAFPYQNGQLGDSCFSTGPAVVAKIDRYRFYLGWYLEDGTVAGFQDEGARPYLMLDQGLRDTEDKAIVTPVAANVEDLQFSYYFQRAAAGGPAQISGAAPGTNLADDVFPVNVRIRPPAIDDPSDASSRSTGSPANILAVRVSVVVRTEERNIAWTAADDTSVPAIGNRDAYTGSPQYRRAVFEQTFLLPNFGSGSIVYCAIGTAAGYNLGGC